MAGSCILCCLFHICETGANSGERNEMEGLVRVE